MDADLSKAVIKTFVELYKKKIIYKDTKLVNWDTKLETAISDLEVEQKEVQSNLYYIKYKIENVDNFLTIATTRPETMLGDTAVAVNPNDIRYKTRPHLGLEWQTFLMNLVRCLSLVKPRIVLSFNFNDI